MSFPSGDREDYGINDERFALILTSAITQALSSDAMLAVLIDSEVEHRIGVSDWNGDNKDAMRVKAQITLEGLQAVINTFNTLVASNFDVDAAVEMDKELRTLEVPDDLSGLDWE